MLDERSNAAPNAGCGNHSGNLAVFVSVQIYFGVNFCPRNTALGGWLPTARTAANYFLCHYFEKPAGQSGFQSAHSRVGVPGRRSFRPVFRTETSSFVFMVEQLGLCDTQTGDVSCVFSNLTAKEKNKNNCKVRWRGGPGLGVVGPVASSERPSLHGQRGRSRNFPAGTLCGHLTQWPLVVYVTSTTCGSGG